MQSLPPSPSRAWQSTSLGYESQRWSDPVSVGVLLISRREFQQPELNLWSWKEMPHSSLCYCLSCQLQDMICRRTFGVLKSLYVLVEPILPRELVRPRKVVHPLVRQHRLWAGRETRLFQDMMSRQNKTCIHFMYLSTILEMPAECGQPLCETKQEVAATN